MPALIHQHNTQKPLKKRYVQSNSHSRRHDRHSGKTLPHKTRGRENQRKALANPQNARANQNSMYWQASTNLINFTNKTIMANYIYARVSTGGQTFEQQMQTITEHFRKIGSDIANADKIITEHVSGAVEWRQRKLRQLVEQCNDGDTIFVSELSRLGRDQADIFSLVDYATKKKGLNLFICKDNLMLENKTQGGKFMLFLYSMQAESERINTCERNLARSAWEREQIAKYGGFVSKGGKWTTKQGRPKGCDLSIANAASALARANAAAQWKAQSVGYKWAMDRVREGWPDKKIVEEFNKLHEYQPEVYCTRTGKPLSYSRLSLWKSETNLTLVV